MIRFSVLGSQILRHSEFPSSAELSSEFPLASISACVRRTERGHISFPAAMAELSETALAAVGEVVERALQPVKDGIAKNRHDS